jgi:hypothetical protein
MRQRHYPGGGISERGQIELNLRDVSMSVGAGKKFNATSF